MAHLAAPVGAGLMAHPDAEGEAGAAECGDLVRIQLRITSGHIAEARFLAHGCGGATAAASAACARLKGAAIDDALRLSADDLDRDLGGLAPARRHGLDLVEDAVSRAMEAWFSARLGRVGLPHGRRRVVVGMSGGVDSAVAAMLLRDAGWDVVGVTMRLWHDPSTAAAERSCCSPDTVRRARASAHALGLPHLTIDAVDTFRRGVVDAFAQGYRSGRTPNPCVTCNGEVRFRVLTQVGALLGARHVATGHYARVEAGAIAAARHREKDQSYMLARLSTAVLRRVMFPLGDMTKNDVRALAAKAALPASGSIESQEVCFVGQGGYVPFLERAYAMEESPGQIVDESGRVRGTHSGYWRYTVGQRRGIGIASDGPLYVLRTDAATNSVVVGPRERLAAHRLRLENLRLTDDSAGPLDVRVRYRGRSLRGTVRPSGEEGVVTLETPADGVAPGQTAALYRDGRLVGAGVIAEAMPEEAPDGH
jgi:tRNA-uridine 2-sulfurtransferase